MISHQTKKQILNVLIIFCLLTTIVLAQKVGPQQEGKKYGEPGFRGEPISLNVVNADI